MGLEELGRAAVPPDLAAKVEGRLGLPAAAAVRPARRRTVLAAVAAAVLLAAFGGVMLRRGDGHGPAAWAETLQAMDRVQVVHARGELRWPRERDGGLYHYEAWFARPDLARVQLDDDSVGVDQEGRLQYYRPETGTLYTVPSPGDFHTRLEALTGTLWLAATAAEEDAEPPLEIATQEVVQDDPALWRVELHRNPAVQLAQPISRVVLTVDLQTDLVAGLQEYWVSDGQEYLVLSLEEVGYDEELPLPADWQQLAVPEGTRRITAAEADDPLAEQDATVLLYSGPPQGCCGSRAHPELRFQFLGGDQGGQLKLTYDPVRRRYEARGRVQVSSTGDIVENGYLLAPSPDPLLPSPARFALLDPDTTYRGKDAKLGARIPGGRCGSIFAPRLRFTALTPITIYYVYDEQRYYVEGRARVAPSDVEVENGAVDQDGQLVPDVTIEAPSPAGGPQFSVGPWQQGP